MEIVVCVKEVPLVSELRFDSEKKTLVREGVPREVNTFDVVALSKAVEIKKEHGGHITAITMGPPQARDALVQCLATGADRAILLTDSAFAGADTLATSRALSMAIKRLRYDLVICGRNSVDAETGQVGPEMAELLDLPQVTAVRRLEVDPVNNTITAERETDAGYEVIQCPLPALVTAAESLAAEIWPSEEQLEAARSQPMEEWSARDLSEDLSLFGTLGSPTSVAEIRSVTPQRKGIVFEEGSTEVAIQKLVAALLEDGLFSTQLGETAGSRTSIRSREQRRGKALWVVAETAQGEPRDATLELLGKAGELADRLKGEVAAVVLGQDGASLAPILAAYGADTIYVADDPRLTPYNTEGHAAVLTTAVRALDPYAVLFSSTANGRDLAPRIAARLQLGLTGDCIDLDIDAAGRLVQLKPAFGGNIVAPILTRTAPAMVTVRPGMFGKPVPDWSQKATVHRLEVPATMAIRTRVLETRYLPSSAADLDSAQIVVAVGMGIGGPENLPVVEKLAKTMGASLAATRNVTDAGWLPKQQQVGLTGRAIAPWLYIAVGVRGAFNHMVGIQRAGIIVGINKNPKASIFKAADYGIVGDYAAVVPALIEALEKAKEGKS